MPELSGWGRFPKSSGQLLSVQTDSEVLQHLRTRGSLQVIARGAGRSYGDVAINRDNLCLDFMPLNRFLGFDAHTGILHAEAGVTLEAILETFVPKGWFLPVTPGTKYPTLGGSIASDVHGKSHYNLAHFVKSVRMLLADGTPITCSAQKNSELFWATMGGMGLTGIILSAEIQLQRIESSYIKYNGVKAKNLEDIFRLFEETPDQLMTVAWIDCLAQGKSLGRSIMMRGEFARKADLKTSGQRKNPLIVPRKLKLNVPCDFPGICLNPLSMHAFNFAYYNKHPKEMNTIMDYDNFFYPLDFVLHWNRAYGKQGMLQYQFLIPPKFSFEGIKTLLEAISKTGKASFLAVLKKFGSIKNQGLLSFPMPGYFIALDFPFGDGSILKHMDAWDELVLKFGGRLYLAKDSRMKADTFAAMYPRLGEWLKVKQKVDPQNIFCSDMARRLGLFSYGKAAHAIAKSGNARKKDNRLRGIA